MFQNYEICNEITTNKQIKDRIIKNFPMKSFFYVNLRFFYEMH